MAGKRLRIIDRDNFTCQNISCKTFDPSSGEVQILEVDDELQIHSYNSYESIYTLSSSLTKLTLNIDFGWETGWCLQSYKFITNVTFKAEIYGIIMIAI